MSINNVSNYIGISTSSIKRLIEVNDFVEGIQITTRRVVYRTKDIQNWVDRRSKNTNPEVIGVKKKVRCPSTPIEVNQAYDQELAELKIHRGL